MKKRNFTTTISVDQTPHEAFAAINNVRGWWSENIEGSTANLGDEWTYRYKDAHRCTMKVTEMVPNKKVVWLVVDNYFNFTQDKTEWTNTKIVFEISTQSDKTEIRFTHEGFGAHQKCSTSARIELPLLETVSGTTRVEGLRSSRGAASVFVVGGIEEG